MQAIGNQKMCSSCRELLPIGSFCRNRVTKDKLQNACRSCKAVMNRNWKYSLRNGDIDRMTKAQSNKCAICKLPPINEKLFVDHDHSTGAIRQLLCIKCNSLLGMCRDDIEILLRAIDYLKHHRTQGGE